MRKGKYIPVQLTPDAELNREALGKEVMDSISLIEDAIGSKVRMIALSVVQDSASAKRITRAHMKYKKIKS